MHTVLLKFSVLWIVFSSPLLFSANIGLLITATGQYISFVDPLIESAEEYFCKGHQITYFVFTDTEMDSRDNVIYLFQPRFGWPFDTMLRGQGYYQHHEMLASQDYLFACDADMLFVGDIGDEILGERVATMHPGFVGQRGSYEENATSTAYVSAHEGIHYFAGGFYGGTTNEVLNIVSTINEHVYKDLANGFIAEWHDESHWNRYCIDHPPTIVLSADYCMQEPRYIPGKSKLLALEKDHAALRLQE